MLVSPLHTPSVLGKPSSAMGLRKVCQVKAKLIPSVHSQSREALQTCVWA